MPAMHSESTRVQAQASLLFPQLGNQGNLNFALRRKAVIDRFGRNPLAGATVLVAAPALSMA